MDLRRIFPWAAARRVGRRCRSPPAPPSAPALHPHSEPVRLAAAVAAVGRLGGRPGRHPGALRRSGSPPCGWPLRPRPSAAVAAAVTDRPSTAGLGAGRGHHPGRRWSLALTPAAGRAVRQRARPTRTSGASRWRCPGPLLLGPLPAGLGRHRRRPRRRRRCCWRPGRGWPARSSLVARAPARRASWPGPSTACPARWVVFVPGRPGPPRPADAGRPGAVRAAGDRDAPAGARPTATRST